MARIRKRKKNGVRYTRNKRRKGLLAFALPWMKRFGLALGIIVLTVWVGAWLWLSGSIHAAGNWAGNKALEVSALAGFSVNNILVEGRVHTDPDVVLGLLNMHRGDPLFAFDTAEAQDLLERLAWVREARIERRWPDTLYIRLIERQPVALWQKNKVLKVLDETGEVITGEGLSRFKDLLIVMGEGSAGHAPDLVADLQAVPTIGSRVTSARRIGDRRWDLIIDKTITVKLPEEDPGLALQRLAKAQEEGKLLDKDIQAVDLREFDRLTVRTRPGAVQAYKAGYAKGDEI